MKADLIGMKPAPYKGQRMLLHKALTVGTAVTVLACFADPGDAAIQKFKRVGFIKTSENVNKNIRKNSRKNTRKNTEKNTAKSDARATFGDIPKGQLQIVVSIAQQHVTLYSNGVRVAQGPVSTGVPGRPTPMGVFSVIQKDRYHHSNLYSNAPMPYMQRITWSGVAMHEGPLPGYPASHGCIRLAHDFAARLWVTTKLGVRVIVARTDVAPYEFSHAKLFNPKEKPTGTSEVGLIDGLRPMLAADQSGTGAGLPPIRIAQAATGVGGGSAAISPAPRAVEPSTSGEPEKPIPAGTEPQKPPLPKSRAAEPNKYSGQVAVFVSKKEKKVFVRQGFVPVFDMPVEIANPDQPLGTHVFTAMEVLDGGARMRWNAISLPAEQWRSVETDGRNRRGSKKSEPPPRQPAVMKPPSAAAEALDRIVLPQAAIDRISEVLVPGSSLVVSDSGLGGETGNYTDFIVLTH